jgi:hypothetical protein
MSYAVGIAGGTAYFRFLNNSFVYFKAKYQYTSTKFQINKKFKIPMFETR